MVRTSDKTSLTVRNNGALCTDLSYTLPSLLGTHREPANRETESPGFERRLIPSYFGPQMSSC
jgi:hypothetical protein